MKRCCTLGINSCYAVQPKSVNYDNGLIDTVIPAKAGIYIRLDSRLRGNDECVTSVIKIKQESLMTALKAVIKLNQKVILIVITNNASQK